MANIELTGSQVKELHALDPGLNDLEQVLIRARRAGLDVTEIQQRINDAKAKRIGLLQNFSPGLTAREKR